MRATRSPLHQRARRDLAQLALHPSMDSNDSLEVHYVSPTVLLFSLSLSFSLRVTPSRLLRFVIHG